jgi:hypothetical protein
MPARLDKPLRRIGAVKMAEAQLGEDDCCDRSWK